MSRYNNTPSHGRRSNFPNSNSKHSKNGKHPKPFAAEDTVTLKDHHRFVDGLSLEQPKNVHFLIGRAEKLIEKYRLQSAVLYAQQITATQEPAKDEYNSSNCVIGFQFWDKFATRVCKPSSDDPVWGSSIMVYETKIRRWVKFHEFLTRMAPPNIELCTGETLSRFHANNGKSFPWAELPDELKLMVLAHCHEPSPIRQTHATRRVGFRVRTSRIERGLQRNFELIHTLGPWYSLLKVSKGIRALTLDTGFRHILFSFIDPVNVANCISRMETVFQLAADNPVPRNVDEKLAFAQYMSAPKRFPEHQRFSTMAHGIRKVSLSSFSAPQLLSFLNMKIPSRSRQSSGQISCMILSKLPNIRMIYLVLPQFRSDNSFWNAEERVVWYAGNPCQRLVHRWITDGLLKEFAGVPEIYVEGFLDGEEFDRFAVNKGQRPSNRSDSRCPHSQPGQDHPARDTFCPRPLRCRHRFCGSEHKSCPRFDAAQDEPARPAVFVDNYEHSAIGSEDGGLTVSLASTSIADASDGGQDDGPAAQLVSTVPFNSLRRNQLPVRCQCRQKCREIMPFFSG